MSANTVHVKNISKETSEKEVKDFFSFCGKITSLELGPVGETQNANVVFEKEMAAKTALLLDNTQLGKTQVKVESAAGTSLDESTSYTSNEERDSDEITQEEKPRSRIIAEYLAHGYVVGDTAAQRAIDLDQKHGVSSRFLNTLTNLNNKYHATDKAKGIDQSYGVTQKTNSLLSGLTSYYEKAAGTPTGQKLVNFYTSTSQQVQDIHAEARRLADIKKQNELHKVSGTEKTTCKCGSISGSCPCEAGSCACADCGKSDVKKVAGSNKTTCGCGGNTSVCGCELGECACNACPKAQTEKIAGTEKTVCKCGAKSGDCPCEAGSCACADCGKSDVKKVAGSNKTTCGCGGDTSVCGCELGECACNSCPKAQTEKVAGSEKTTCKCGGDDTNCPCIGGKCACSGCSK